MKSDSAKSSLLGSNASASILPKFNRPVMKGQAKRFDPSAFVFLSLIFEMTSIFISRTKTKVQRLKIVSLYLTSTVAPASVSFCLIVSASSFETPSFTAFGAASTKSLASFKPSAVTSRTTLMTLILLPPAA